MRGNVLVRVRFAPSPTGYLHVGSARTALFNWLFARHHKGSFVLRIEDTDRERSTEDSIRQILEAMEWLGLDWDEYCRQTEREEAHQRAATRLIDGDRAYEHEGAWWFRVPNEGCTVVHDELLGEVAFEHEQLKDFVIRRSDGTFVYNFVVVVDDAEMGITHVIRGDDHLNNTPKQILLYRALDHAVPKFAHLPLILGPDRARLSKRHGVTSVLEYRERGFLPETMVNFLARLGWSHGDQEVFNVSELIELFSLANINASAAIFEESKLHWLNQQHLKEADLDRLVRLVEPFVVKRTLVTQAMWDEADSKRLRRGGELLRHRCKTLDDLAKWMALLFPVEIEREQAVDLDDHQRGLIGRIVTALEQGEEGLMAQGVEDLVRRVMQGEGAKLKDIAAAVRMAVTGQKAGPGLFDTLALVGRELTVSRLREFVKG